MDLGIDWLDHDFYESHQEPNGPVALGRFLLSISSLESFRGPLEEACVKQGVLSAESGIFVYDLAYPQERPFPCPYLRFIGAFPYTSDR